MERLHKSRQDDRFWVTFDGMVVDQDYVRKVLKLEKF